MLSNDLAHVSWVLALACTKNSQRQVYDLVDVLARDSV